jgi:hypothetical protein
MAKLYRMRAAIRRRIDMDKMFQTDRRNPPPIKIQALTAAEVCARLELKEKARLVTSQRNGAEATRGRSPNRQTICHWSRFREFSWSPRSQCEQKDIQQLAWKAGSPSNNKSAAYGNQPVQFSSNRLWWKARACSLPRWPMLHSPHLLAQPALPERPTNPQTDRQTDRQTTN